MHYKAMQAFMHFGSGLPVFGKLWKVSSRRVLFQAEQLLHLWQTQLYDERRAIAVSSAQVQHAFG